MVLREIKPCPPFEIVITEHLLVVMPPQKDTSSSFFFAFSVNCDFVYCHPWSSLPDSGWAFVCVSTLSAL